MKQEIDTLLPLKLNIDDASYTTVKDLDYALKCADSKNIRNIALTGPFGSGKSSVLMTLMSDFKDEHRVYLPISLATLQTNEDEDNNEHSNNEKEDNQRVENLNRKIEYSILQQLIYREETKTVPNSRFRRIVHFSSKELRNYAIGAVITIIAFLIVFEPSCAKVETLYNLFNLGYIWNTIFDVLGACWLLYAIYAVFRYILKSYSNSKLNKLNLKDGEIEIVEDNSIFNKHLDEVLYFFQVTDYNVVIIEDLDRFGTSDIFLKLRELNQLINESKIVNRHITFVYAIKDDVFRDEERTKFFDYITTVIPVINPSNSKDKLKYALKAKGFNENEIADDDLSEMAFFIQDMRILTNIVNEYKQYRDKLCRNGQQLNCTKMLAMIVYKNYYPQDFAKLHRREGKVYKCISMKRAFVSNATQNIIEQERELKEEEDLYLSTKHLSIVELRLLFLYDIRKSVNENMRTILIDDSYQSFDTIANDDEKFDYLLTCDSITYQYYHYNSYYTNSSCVNMSTIDKNVNYSRRANVLKKDTNGFLQRKKQLREQKLSVKSLRLSDLLSHYGCGQLNLYKDIDLSPMQDVFLRRGLIDEEYYDYISYFYEGMVSLADRELLLSIKRQISQPFDSHIDKISNFVKELKPYMFESDAILNIELLDYFAVDKQDDWFELFMKRLERESIQTSFLAQYYNYGHQQATVFHHYIKWNTDSSWNNIIESENEDEKLSLIEAFFKFSDKLNDIQLYWLNNNYNFIANHVDGIGLQRCIELVKSCHFEKLSDESVELLSYVVKYDSYILTAHNIVCIIKNLYSNNIVCENNLNYTCVTETGNDDFIFFISENIKEALMCFKDTNKNESTQSILYLLNNEKLEKEDKECYLMGQHNAIENFDNIKEDVYDIAIKCNILIPTWENISCYYTSTQKLTNELVAYIEHNKNKLIERVFPNDDANISNLFIALFAHDTLSIKCYSDLLFSFERVFGKCEELKNLDKQRLIILINSGKIPFNENTLSIMNETEALAEFILKEPMKFMNHLDLSYNLSSECVEKILSSSIFSLLEKRKIINIIPKETIIAVRNISEVIIDAILASNDINLHDEILFHLLASNVKLAKKVRLAILMISEHNTDFEYTEKVLKTTNEKYADICNTSKRTTVKVSPYNKDMLEILTRIEYISSYKETKDSDVYRIYHKQKKQ